MPEIYYNVHNTKTHHWHWTYTITEHTHWMHTTRIQSIHEGTARTEASCRRKATRYIKRRKKQLAKQQEVWA